MGLSTNPIFLSGATFSTNFTGGWRSGASGHGGCQWCYRFLLVLFDVSGRFLMTGYDFSLFEDILDSPSQGPWSSKIEQIIRKSGVIGKNCLKLPKKTS